MTSLTVIIFVIVYLGMALGRLPWLAIDRTGVALLGLIALLAVGELSLTEAAKAIDIPTIALLFALMIVSAQFEMSGFYRWVAARLTRAARTPRRLLAAIIIATGALSAILTNDVVAFALTPLICAGLAQERVDARPYLIAVAAAANAGSAATLIGNPQNILIGQVGGVTFGSYSLLAAVPVLLALLLTHVAIIMTWGASFAATTVLPQVSDSAISIDRFQTAKGLVAIAALIVLFMTPVPREISALGIAGLLLLSRKLASRDMIGATDWHLLLLFICLFGVTEAFVKTGLTQEGVSLLATYGLRPEKISVMAPLMLFASNTIGNVPTIILLLKVLPDLPHGVLTGVALLSTFAGNLLLTGSMCNIIVAERGAASGVTLRFWDFARSGIVIAVGSMAIACGWLWFTGLMAP